MITLPARDNAPETNLFVEVVKKEGGLLPPSSPLFMLPGGPGANSTHFNSYRCLQDTTDLIFFDPRGCGRSDKKDPSSYNLENYIEDIEGLRIALGLEKISLLGKSYSGLCALGYALRYPENLDMMILAATGPSYRFIETAKKKLAQIGSPEQVAASEKLWEGQFKSSEEVEEYFTIMMPLYSTKSYELTPVESGSTLPFAHEPLNRGFLTDMRTVDFTDKLEQIHCRTLILTGDSDWIFADDYSRLMAEKIPGSMLTIFPDVGHFLETDAGPAYFDVIRQFAAASACSR